MGLRRLCAGLILAASLGLAGPSRAQVTPNSVTLTWTAPGDDSLIGNATRYDLRYSTSAITAANFLSATAVATPPTPVAPGSAQSFVVSGLLSSTAYWFALRTQDDAGNWSAISNVVTKTTLAAPDVTRPAPIAVSVSSVTDTSATLSWTAVGDDSLTGTATSYDVRYSSSPITAANWSAATQVTNEPAPLAAGSAQTYVVHPLGRQQAYYFAIKATDDAGNTSALSNAPGATTTDTMPPMAIKDLTASFVWLGWPAAPPARAGRGR
ncbi:MAG: fibronectin type III domain-containing protein [Candidatus Eisenbacteria bacterium]|nr:fibronectin type III domain-containing protein [Candidatus Eisenbacteria bacterium]